MAPEAKRHFPAFLDLDRRLAVVIGEGPAIEKRVRQLSRYGADIVVVSPSPSPWLVQSESDGLLTLEHRAYVRGDLAGAFVALCITEEAEVQAAVFDEAESIGCLVNIAGRPELCSFILPSITHRGPMQVAVSTGGAAPELAKLARKRVEEAVGEEWGAWVALLASVRALAQERISDEDERARVIAAAVDPSVLERLSAGEELTAEEFLSESGHSEGSGHPEGEES